MIVQMSSCLSFHRYEVLGNRASVFVTDRLIAISSNLPIKYHKIVSLSLLQAVSGIHLCTPRLSTQSINRGAQEMVSNPDFAYKYQTVNVVLGSLLKMPSLQINAERRTAECGHSHELHECQFLHHEFYGIWLISPKPSMNSKNGHCWFHEFQE